MNVSDPVIGNESKEAMKKVLENIQSESTKRMRINKVNKEFMQ